MSSFFGLFKYSEAPHVGDTIPNFDRAKKEWAESNEGKEMLGMLRALKGIGFIEPLNGGQWQKDSKIVITEIGKEFKKYLKE